MINLISCFLDRFFEKLSKDKKFWALNSVHLPKFVHIVNSIQKWSSFFQRTFLYAYHKSITKLL